MIAAIGSGFVTSSLLNRRLHADGVPELARYAVGGLLIVLCYRILYPDDERGARRVMLAAACSGIGVAVARLWAVLVD